MLENENAIKAKLKKMQNKKSSKKKEEEPDEEITIIPVNKDIEQEQADHEKFAARIL